MSEYFTFYIGKRTINEDGTKTYSIIGPYFNGKLHSIVTRSRSFINNDIIDDYFNTIQVSQMDDELKEHAAVRLFLSTNKDDLFSQAYTMSFQDLRRNASSAPKIGYVTIEEYNDIMNGDAYYYDADVKSFEYYAGLPQCEKDKYCYVCFTSKRSPEYIFNVIAEVADDLYDEDEDDLCVIAIRG